MASTRSARTQPTPISLPRALACLLMALSLALASFTGFAAEPVGEALLVAGTVTRSQASDSPVNMTAGAAIYAGDHLVTAANSRLQLKMNDQALIVLMPDSELVIHQYDSQGQDPAGYVLRLELIRGRMRSVSGLAGQANHDAFRLNTPIAAIGIRGTDFTTQASEHLTRVRLHSGSVVLSPYSQNCLASALGACNTADSLILQETLTRAAELRANDARPRAINADEIPLDAPLEQDDHALNLLNTPAIDGQGFQQPAPPPDNIHWGRWHKTPLESIPLAGLLLQEGKRVVFANDQLVLFRDGYTQLGTHAASFRLEDSVAFINGSNGLTPAQLSGGRLNIDFEQRAFSTGLTAQVPFADAPGPLELNASGSINLQGHLIGTQGNMDVLGALSNDNRQAGYLFEHQLDDGTSLQGATQWRQR
jgi:hypothetical protein